MAETPNIVICQCDQLRWAELGCYGHPVFRTPMIDRLADRGVRFENAVVACPSSTVSRAALLSGQYSRRCVGGLSGLREDAHGVYMPEYPARGRPCCPDTTLAEALVDRGYHTAAIGEWRVPSWPDEMGFEEYCIPRAHDCHSGQIYTEDGGPEFAPDGWSVDFEASRVDQYLHDRAHEQSPFFLYYNISPPHCPVADGPEHYVHLYDPKTVELRPNVHPDQLQAGSDHWLKVYRWDYRYYLLGLPHTQQLPEGYDIRHVVAEYGGMISWVDDTVGKLVNNLARHRVLDRTILVFTSDHGDYLGSHNRFQEEGLHDEPIRVPLIFSAPQALTPRVIEHQVASNVDLMPTLLELAGCDVPDSVDGRSLAGVLRGDAAVTDRPHAFVETSQEVGIRTASHLYALPLLADESARPPSLGEEPTLFYDMTTDPYQQRNLAGTGAQADTAAQLDRLIRVWDVDTPWLAPTPDRNRDAI
jgi:choline-sulfatase